MQSDRIILGIDPGTVIMGYGIIAVSGKQVRMLTLGVLKLSKYADHLQRLKTIFERTTSLIGQYHPDEIAIEAPFFGKNVQSMLKLGRAQGVVMAAALHLNIPIFEYSPRRIKQSVTGKGGASKEQVASMLFNILNIKETPESLDATDGLAAAMCHFLQQGKRQNGVKQKGWKDFLNNNPDRYISF